MIRVLKNVEVNWAVRKYVSVSFCGPGLTEWDRVHSFIRSPNFVSKKNCNVSIKSNDSGYDKKIKNK